MGQSAAAMCLSWAAGWGKLCEHCSNLPFVTYLLLTKVSLSSQGSQGSQLLLELVLPYVNSKCTLARCCLVGQHTSSMVHETIQKRFLELLPVFANDMWDDISYSSLDPGCPAQLQWFCSVAGRERMRSTEAAVTALTKLYQVHMTEGKFGTMAEAGESKYTRNWLVRPLCQVWSCVTLALLISSFMTVGRARRRVWHDASPVLRLWCVVLPQVYA